MKTKANVKAPADKRNPDTVTVVLRPGDDPAALVAQTHLRPTMQAAATVREYGKGKEGDGPDINALIAELERQAETASGGDLKRAEAMLVAQGHTLDALFNHLSRRAIQCEHVQNLEVYLRLALKAQSQCRATLETLAMIKNPPPVAFVRQQNIGVNQQVNNGVAPAGDVPRARDTEIEQSKLLEAQHGERLDTGTAGTAIGADPHLATVGEIHRAKDA